MESIFKYSTIRFQQRDYPTLHSVSLDTNETYGSCMIHVDSYENSPSPILFHFMIDVSGSMIDMTENGRTKIQLLTHTLINMVHYFAETSQNVFIQVKGFDDCIHNYIDTVQVTKDNVDEIVGKLAKIRPLHLTNIGLALETMETDMKHSKISNQVGIFLTDGDVTAGEMSADVLVKYIPSDIPFHFIAFGSDHNPYLMHQLGHCSQYTNNWFITDIEQTGNVYGEILYNELHRVGENVKLEIHNGRLYDYYAQEFVTTLNIGSLYAQTEKHYHVITDNADECFVVLKCTRCDTGEYMETKITDLPPLLSEEQENDGVRFQFMQPKFDLIQYFRLATQIYLGKARKMLFQNNPSDDGCLLNENPFCHNSVKSHSIEIYIPFRAMVHEFYSIMCDNMELHKLSDNEYMKCLCDDISILLQTLGTLAQLKYCALREDVQGQERTGSTVTVIHDRNIEFDMILPVLSRSNTTPYRTPGRVDLMNTMSQSISDEPDQENDRALSIQIDIFPRAQHSPSPILRRKQSQMYP